MKKWSIILIVLSVTCFTDLFAQQFQVESDFRVSDSLKYSMIEPVDFDNDGLLDVMLLAKGEDGVSPGLQIFHFLKYDLLNGYSSQTYHATNYDTLSYVVTDYNRDNKMDILITGMKAGVWKTDALINQGNFIFIQEELLPEGGTLIETADLNNDGKAELIISGDYLRPFLHVYEGAPGNWHLAYDTLEVHASAVTTSDFNGDGFVDLFVSGQTADETAYSRLLINRTDSLSFTVQTPDFNELQGELAQGDYNHDGQMDILQSGVTLPGGSLSTQLLINNQGNFQTYDDIELQQGNSPIIADLDSDGLADLSLIKENNISNSILLVNHYQNIQDTLKLTNYTEHAFGDLDRDGDLDLMVLHQMDSTWISYYDNTTSEINKAPIMEGLAWGTMIYDRAFAYWEKAVDDHTPQEAISYDMSIIGQMENIVLGHFDAVNESRLDVDHGNQGLNNYALIKTSTTPNPSDLIYSVQALDNAFYAGSSKLCQGLGGGEGAGDGCNDVRYVSYAACKGQYKELKGDVNTSWFSFSEGFLGQMETYTTQFTEPDTVFSVTPIIESGCLDIKVYNFYPFDSTDYVVYKPILSCVGNTLDLYIDIGGDSVIWQSALTGYITTTDTINYTVTKPDTVTAFIQGFESCQRMVKFIVNIDEGPSVQLNGESFQIESGQSVQLLASGGQQYSWTPTASLNFSNRADPKASPDVTTTYTVTVTDSAYACPATADVLVRVVEAGLAYIPNMFTPNGDNMNDRLIMFNHNMSDVSEFKFVINNREGNRVYITSEMDEAVQSGWDGTSNGVPQPGGVYYWSVKGKKPNGDKLLLNGKSSGSLLLVR